MSQLFDAVKTQQSKLPTTTDKLIYSGFSLIPFFIVFWAFIWFMTSTKAINVERPKFLVGTGVAFHLVFFGLILAFMYLPIPDSQSQKN